MQAQAKPEHSDSELIQRMLDDAMWNLGIGLAAGLVVGAVVLPRGAGGSRALLAGLGGGFGAGRVYERYNVALTDMQGGGLGVMPEHGLSIASVKDALVGPGGAVEKVKSAVGFGDKTASGSDRA
ncbi:hypothetical protein FNF27_05723 [Cafeteria roenbergensis]|uniref:Uncharacterized protein n=1 Tax=Cafeteria roenbergensis TaxID=33653 RepID=A0A5A8E4W5_CAFRO|nr:hypothetical protein FNF27_05723 [Cafeteria roenbergensis]